MGPPFTFPWGIYSCGHPCRQSIFSHSWGFLETHGLLRCRAVSRLTPKVQGARSLLVWTLGLSVLCSPSSWKACTHELAPWGPEPSLRHVSHWPGCRPSPAALLLRSGSPAPHSWPHRRAPPHPCLHCVCCPSPSWCLLTAGRGVRAAPTLPKSWRHPETHQGPTPLGWVSGSSAPEVGM